MSEHNFIVWPPTPFGATLELVTAELDSALRRFESFNSGHEGKAVIEEELEELWDCIKANVGSSDDAMAEAIQVAAMAMRYVLDLGDPVRLNHLRRGDFGALPDSGRLVAREGQTP